MVSTDRIVKEYLAEIGRRGGKKSRRHLETASAKQMVKVREAKRAFRRYYAQCFWSYDPDLVITKDDIQWVAEQLMKNGSLESWKIGRRLCQ